MREQISGTEALNLKVIAHIRTDFKTKFGIPRQSGLADTKAVIVFEPEFRSPDAVRGIEEYSYLWLLWGFSEVKREGWSATVRPPRLGGNERVGVFATRSPFRPNPIGLSSVRLDKAEYSEKEGPLLHVAGADLMDGTPIYDIKPYLPYADAHPDASGGFAERRKDYELKVVVPEEWRKEIPEEQIEPLEQILAQDPRPSYQQDSDRVYGMEYAGMEIRFQVDQNVLSICYVGGDK